MDRSRIFESSAADLAANEVARWKLELLLICKAWQVEPWPVSMEAIQCLLPRSRKGPVYPLKDSSNLFFTYQRRHMQIEISPVIRGASRDYARSFSRGL